MSDRVDVGFVRSAAGDLSRNNPDGFAAHRFGILLYAAYRSAIIDRPSTWPCSTAHCLCRVAKCVLSGIGRKQVKRPGDHLVAGEPSLRLEEVSQQPRGRALSGDNVGVCVASHSSKNSSAAGFLGRWPRASPRPRSPA